MDITKGFGGVLKPKPVYPIITGSFPSKCHLKNADEAVLTGHENLSDMSFLQELHHQMTLRYFPEQLQAFRGSAPVGHHQSKKRVFQCPHCRYITDRKNNLKRHVTTMHSDCGRTLECCEMRFHSKASLRDHVYLFHRAGYRCRFCSRNFVRKALLKRHLAVHFSHQTTQSINQQAHCTSAFDSQSHLPACHLEEQTHQNISSETVAQDKSLKQMDTFVWQRLSKPWRARRLCFTPYKCNKCKGHFADQFALEDHSMDCSAVSIHSAPVLPLVIQFRRGCTTYGMNTTPWNNWTKVGLYTSVRDV